LEDEMGKLVVTEFITLDGVIEDPGGAESFEHGGWLGTGKRLFDGAPPTPLRLSDSRPVGPDGVFVLAYESVREAAGA
jgi:hypothetical protein